LTKQLWAPWRLEYIQSADEAEGCFLCEAAIGDDDEQLLVVHRGETAFVVMNKYPYSSGHLLVAPRRHGVEFGELDDTEALELHRLGAAAVEALRAGADLLYVPGDAANQEEAYRAVLAAVRKGKISNARFAEALGRVAALKRAAAGEH
jgi:hypothetical protein